MKIKGIRCNYSEIFKCIIIFLAFLGMCFTAYLSQNEISGDFLWLYNMSLKMVNGYMPYRDINMIVTPLMFQIAELFMRVFGDSAFVFYICMSILGAMFPVTIYKLLKKINKSTTLNWCLIIFLTLAYSFLGLFLYSYNITTIWFIFIAMIFELKKQEKSKKIYDYLIGVMLGLSAASKQTIGGLAIIFSLLYDVYKTFYLKKSDIKGSILRKILGILTIAIPYLAWLLINKSLMSFLDQCIFAVFEFGHKNKTGSFFNYYTLISVLFVGISICLCFMKKARSMPGYEKMSVITFYTIPTLFIIVPIMNTYHCALMLMGAIPLLFFYINLFFENKLVKFNNASWIPFLMFLGFMLVSTGSFLGAWNYDKMNNSIEKYKYIGLNDEQIKDINEVTEYIKDKEALGFKVYILSPDAGIYMIPLERYDNNKFDLLFQGNLGYDGENRLVETMKKMRNTIFLKREDLFYQESEIIDNYVKESYKVVDEINGYNVYATNDVVF